MSTFVGILLMGIVLMIGVESHNRHRTQGCREGGYQLLAFYDPTDTHGPGAHSLLMQFGHPTYQDCPTTFWQWQRLPIDWMTYHNARPSLTTWRLPALRPPIRLADGTLATDIRQLTQVQESK